MSSWNGGITRQQLAWLRSELAAAEAAAERVIIASHHQLGQGGARATHMAWNWRDVQQVVGGFGGREQGHACCSAHVLSWAHTYT